MNTRREVIGLMAAVAAGATVFTRPARADTYPSKLVRLVTWASPGSGPDVFTRLMAERLSTRWGQTVITENRPGAVGVIGTQQVAKSPPDGYTILVTTNSAHLINPLVKGNLPFDPIADFEPVSQLALGQLALVVSRASPYKTLADFITAAKKGDLSFGSLGPGSGPHLLGIQFQRAASIRLLHVPYKNGEAGQLQDIVGGQLTAGFLSQGSATNERLRALAVAGTSRNSALPDVPTFREAGVAGLEIGGWVGAYVPARTPPAIVDQIAKAMREVLAEPGVRAKVEAMGMTPLGSTPAEFVANYRAELDFWRSIVQSADIPRE